MGRNKKTDSAGAYYASFPTRLRNLLDRPEETQGKLAEAIGVNRQSVGQWKDGITSPDINSLNKIADYYKVSTDYLLGRDDEESPRIEIRAIHDMTGLTAASTEALISLKEDFPETVQIVNGLLSGMNFINLIVSIKKYALDENRELYFVKNGDTPNYVAEKLDGNETSDFRLFKLTKVFDGYIREVIDNLERSGDNGEHSGKTE